MKVAFCFVIFYDENRVIIIDFKIFLTIFIFLYKEFKRNYFYILFVTRIVFVGDIVYRVINKV